MPTRASSRKTRTVLFSLLTAAIIAGAGSGTQAAAAPKSTRAAKAKKAAPAPAAPVAVKEWGPYLDVAYELTYWDKAEIREWREKRDRETGQPLADYIKSWNAQLTEASAQQGNKDGKIPVYRERDYLRLAIARIIDYLQSDNKESLAGASDILDRMKSRAAMPEYAFWNGLAKALLAIEDNNSPEFVAQVYGMWNGAVLFTEQTAVAGAADASQATVAAYQYRNIVNLVANRAIVERGMEDLNALGPLFLTLRERNLEERKEEGQFLTTLTQRIAEGLTAPDSDRYRLNFTVALIEAKRLHQQTAAILDSKGMTDEAQKKFQQARHFYELALKWAASPRSSGAVTAMASYLDITSLAIQRLPENQRAQAYKFFSMLPNQDGSSTILNAMAMYNDISTYSAGGWEKGGYANRDAYVKATHRLWRSIMELSLWTGDFYFGKLKAATTPQEILEPAAPMQVVLNSYLEFLAAQRSRGFADVIPDFAYFGAAEAAEKLSFSYQKTYAYSSDGAGYNLWFLRRLQATELFPFDPPEVGRTAAALRRDGRFNLYLDYFLPLAERMKQSAAVKKWLDYQKGDAANLVREYVNSVDKVYMASASGAAERGDKGYAASFKQLREELQRNPDHPVHQLLKSFYLEELTKRSSFTLLLKDVNRLN